MNLKLLKKLCYLDERTLWRFLIKFLKSYYKNVQVSPDYIIAEGSVPCCLVAHLDTVFPHPPAEIFLDPYKKVMWSPQGLGADDRAGVFAIITLIRKGYRPSIVFTMGEEIGGLGAMALITDYPTCPIQDLKYIIELDRAGEKDCVFYQCDNQNFTDYVSSFGFEEAHGTFSDISTIAPAWEVAAVNLSIGYEDEHSKVERLYINDMEDTINKVSKMLDDADSALSYAFVRKHWKPNTTCMFCGKPIPKGSGVKVESTHVKGFSYLICDECYFRCYK